MLRLETGLASCQSEEILPKGTILGQFCVIVKDNIDFNEETQPGSGTTRHTNGIIIQPTLPADTPIQVTPKKTIEISKRKRTFDSARAPLSSYMPRPEKGPSKQYAFTEASVKTILDSLTETTSNVKLFERIESKLYFEYQLLKHSTIEDRHIPSWSGFNVHLSNTILFRSQIGYLPVIPASPTNMDTIQTIGDRCLEIMEKLKLSNVVVVFDQAVYCKFQEIRLGNPTWENKIIPRLGEFHTCMSFLSIIGKRFGSAGLIDILVAQGSVNGVVGGKMYNRAVRCHKVLSEAMFMQLLDCFFDSIETEELLSAFQRVVQSLQSYYEDDEYSTIPKFYDITKTQSFVQVEEAFNGYIQHFCKTNQTFNLWISYLEMTGLLFNFIHATRTSDWNLHLDVLTEMLPYYSAYDRIHYTRWLPIYLIEMTNLSKTHPHCFENLRKKGYWTAQRTTGPYSALACDQTIEQTLNKQSKTKGGIVGFTLSPSAVDRWTLSRPARASIVDATEKMAGINAPKNTQKYLSKPNIEKYNSDVAKVKSTLSTMINPFDISSTSKHLVCISSGVQAQIKIAEDYSKALEIGKQKMKTYLNSLIETQNYSTPIPQCNLKTFSDNMKKIKSSLEPKQVKFRNDRKMFGRLLIAAQKRPVEFKDMLCNPSGAAPLSLSNPDNTLCKTSKVMLLHKIEEHVGGTLHHVQVSEKLPKAALILDAMAELHSLRLPLPPTFGELSSLILSKIIAKAKRHHCQRVDFVVDRYLQTTIKSTERLRRLIWGVSTLTIFGKQQKTPQQWKKFLTGDKNKTALLKFLFDTWSLTEGDIEVFTTFEDRCRKLTPGDRLDETALECNHEEADTRLLLHAKNASINCENIIISSPDTDVAVIALSLCNISDVKRLYFLTGTGKNKRMLNITSINNCLGPKICTALIGLHCFTGCDSTSAFFGKGKVRAFNLLLSKEKYKDTFSKLGDDFFIAQSDDLFIKLEEFVCDLYGDDGRNINEARYRLFCRTSATEENLPPTKSALLQHAKRACYQAAIHRRSLNPKIDFPSPVGYGWNLTKDLDLEVKWFSEATTSINLHSIVTCGCSTGCESARCSCKKNDLPCIELCQCKQCKNSISAVDEPAEDSDDSDDEEDIP